MRCEKEGKKENAHKTQEVVFSLSQSHSIFKVTDLHQIAEAFFSMAANPSCLH